MKHQWTKMYSLFDSERNPGEKVFLGHRCKNCTESVGDWRGYYPHWYSSPIGEEPPIEVLDIIKLGDCTGVGGEWYEKELARRKKVILKR